MNPFQSFFVLTVAGMLVAAVHAADAGRTGALTGALVLLRRPKSEPTVRQLMSHTAGLAFSSRMETPTLDVLPLRDGAKSYAMTPLDSDPGTRYAYSNAGINTAGRIIEVVSGMA